MNIKPYFSAQTRALFSAALAGSALGVGLSAAYLLQTGPRAHWASAGQITPEQMRAFALVAPFGMASDEPAGPPEAQVQTASTAQKQAGAGGLTRDLDCLTQAVYYEARGESPRGQAAVAQVVINRVRHPAFPKSVCAVVFQGAGGGKADCQFSFVCDGSLRQARDRQAWRRARAVASRALSGEVMSDIGPATHFHKTGLGDIWGEGLVKVSEIGMHAFYRFGHRHSPAASAPSGPAHPVLAGFLPPGLLAGEAKPARSEDRSDVLQNAASPPDRPIATAPSGRAESPPA